MLWNLSIEMVFALMLKYACNLIMLIIIHKEEKLKKEECSDAVASVTVMNE